MKVRFNLIACAVVATGCWTFRGLDPANVNTSDSGSADTAAADGSAADLGDDGVDADSSMDIGVPDVRTADAETDTGSAGTACLNAALIGLSSDDPMTTSYLIRSTAIDNEIAFAVTPAAPAGEPVAWIGWIDREQDPSGEPKMVGVRMTAGGPQIRQNDVALVAPVLSSQLVDSIAIGASSDGSRVEWMVTHGGDCATIGGDAVWSFAGADEYLSCTNQVSSWRPAMGGGWDPYIGSNRLSATPIWFSSESQRGIRALHDPGGANFETWADWSSARIMGEQPTIVASRSRLALLSQADTAGILWWDTHRGDGSESPKELEPGWLGVPGTFDIVAVSAPYYVVGIQEESSVAHHRIQHNEANNWLVGDPVRLTDSNAGEGVAVVAMDMAPAPGGVITQYWQNGPTGAGWRADYNAWSADSNTLEYRDGCLAGADLNEGREVLDTHVDSYQDGNDLIILVTTHYSAPEGQHFISVAASKLEGLYR